MFAASKSGSADAKDANFKNVTMLLHGNGTNGAQNNTFVDSSTNNFTITRNGNTTQGTFTPYGSNWSNYFGGSSDYLTMPDNANYVISGDFTVEAWIFPTSFAGTNGNIVLAQWPGATATNQSFQFYVSSTGKVGLVYGIGATNAAVAGTSLSCTLNTWNHIAVTRSGTTVRYFVNGSVDSTTSTVSGSFNDSTGVMSVGRINASDSGYFSGYISNCRLVTGSALYTSAFTPSTTPLTAISGTQVLVCQANRFADASSNNATITVGGSPSVQRFSPFSPTTAYSTSVIGGSGYFDGSGDYLSTASSSAFGMGTGDFIIESWVYCTSLGATQTINDARTSNTASAYVFAVFSSGALNFYDGPNNTDRTSASGLISLNTWNHVLASRSGTTLKLFVNGAVVSTFTGISSDFGSSQSCTVGRQVSGSGQFNGYIADLRILKGASVTSAFTPPTAPLTAITNTSLLLNFTNAGILDNAMMNDLETVGNAQISTSVKKYGTGSMYFDGTGDGLQAIGTPNTAFGTGDFTVEFWIYLNANTGSFKKFVELGTSGSCFTIETQSTNNVLNVTDLNNTVFITSSTALSLTTWTHVAVTRSGTSMKLFQNGTQVGSATNSTNFANSGNVYIGQSNSGQAVNCYMDDLRITKGFARYTSNFTAPTAAFPDKG